MDASKVQPRQEPLITTTSQRAKSLEKNESSIETRSTNEQDDSSKISTPTVQLSDTSIRLSASSPVKSSDRSAPIENKEQAQQMARQIIADFQSNPAQAQGTHSNITENAVKSLLG
ncbi:hypothetical protein ABXJ76_11345 [Methylobacter sp. G7]|uniref:hypothetical protein n=1 Tax=Methylobacter sp. G7 TaxID=3230117 RepID=UPI003D8027B5